MATLKINNRPSEQIVYRILDISDIQASHLPCNGWQINPRYIYENERQYHSEVSSQQAVLTMALQLDADLLMYAVTATDGAPIVDRRGHVLGGNSRAMALQIAYGGNFAAIKSYKAALIDNTAMLGIAPQDVMATDRPILVRQLVRDITQADGQNLISALNDNYTKSRTNTATYYSRGKRITAKTLSALAQGLADADSLRDYCDCADSLPIVDMLITDGVILDTERNAYIQGGYLNPEGKSLLERSLRSLVCESLEDISRLPAPVLGKLDAAIPYILSASSIHVHWDMTPIFKQAISLLSQFFASAEKKLSIYIHKIDILTGHTPADVYNRNAIAIADRLIAQGKREFCGAYRTYAAQAKISLEAGGFGIGASYVDAAKIIGVNLSNDNDNINNNTDNNNNNDNDNNDNIIDNNNNDADIDITNKITRKRVIRNDCNKKNSKLIASNNFSDLEDIVNISAQKLGKNITLEALSKTQYKVFGNGAELQGYRIIRSGSQWQLRLLDGYDAIDNDNVVNTDDNNDNIEVDNNNNNNKQERIEAYREKIEKKREYYAEKAEKLQNRASALLQHARDMTSVIPLGQPILVGHYSEFYHRRHLDKIHTTYGNAFKTQDKSDYYADKAQRYKTHGVSSDNPEAIEILQNQLNGMAENHQKMKIANKILRDKTIAEIEKREKILEIFPHMHEKDMKIIMQYGFNLAGNSAEMKRVKDRIAQLQKNIERGSIEKQYKDFLYKEDINLNRIMFIFDEKPSEEIRSVLKSYGFRWSPSNVAWQRMLNNTGRYYAKIVIDKIDCGQNRDLSQFLAYDYTACDNLVYNDSQYCAYDYTYCDNLIYNDNQYLAYDYVYCDNLPLQYDNVPDSVYTDSNDDITDNNICAIDTDNMGMDMARRLADFVGKIACDIIRTQLAGDIQADNVDVMQTDNTTSIIPLMAVRLPHKWIIVAIHITITPQLAERHKIYSYQHDIIQLSPAISICQLARPPTIYSGVHWIVIYARP